MNDQEYEKLVEPFCDSYCKFPYICKDEEQLETVCEACPIVKMAERTEKAEDVISKAIKKLQAESKNLESEVNYNYRAGIAHSIAVIIEINAEVIKDADTTDKA
ncbi:MAG: hypothetical protein J6D52_00150 [Clostridia bacterium]|nr:hypothetical protein [Clostridia bacterium]